MPLAHDDAAKTLAAHQRSARGITNSSPDTCECRTEVHPLPDDDLSTHEQRNLAFAAHQIDALEAAGHHYVTVPDRETLAHRILTAQHGQDNADFLRLEGASPWRLALDAADAATALFTGEQHG